MALLMEIPGYKIIDTLGEGGMATVYLAIQESFEREVALKVMSSSLLKDPSFGERFLREARIVSRLVHPNIVTVYDVGVYEGNHYLSMEYVPGEDLKERRYELDLVQALGVVKDVARALDYAGRKGYVHRDVKPENIMLHAEDSRAVLMDFGIARATDVASGMTQTGTTMGTPHYMSPEQAKGAKVDPRSDIYSLGVVLFELVAGFVPYDADSAVAVGIMHVSDAVPRLAPHLAIFQPIIDKALAKKPDERYQLASELIADLNALAAEDIAEVMRQKEAMPVVQAVDSSAATVISSAVMEKVDDPDERPTAARKATAEKNAEGGSRAFSVSADDGIGDYDKQGGNDDDESRRRVGPMVASIVLLLALGAGGWYGWRYWSGQEVDGGNEVLASLPVPSAVSSSSQASSPANDESVGGEDALTTVATPEGDMETLMAETETLSNRLPEDLSVAGPLADLYRQMQAQADTHELGEVGLQALADELDNAFDSALEADNLERARAVQAAAEEAQLARNYGERLRSFTATESQAAVLAEADRYLADDQLTSPEGANALELYRRVLEKDSDNEQALAGVEAIVARYRELSRAALAENALERASTYVQRGLTIAEGDEALLSLRDQVAAAQEAERAREADAARERQRLLTEAQTHFAAGRLITPREGNAFDSYRALQAMQADSTEASEGLRQIEQALIERIESLINGGQLEEAGLLLGSARNHYPQSQSLFALRLSLEQAQEAVSRPSVGRLRVADQGLTELPAEQPQPISPDRIIYLGFDYRNFTGNTSVIQAVLYDSGRSLKIAQVPVIVEGVEGQRFFRIERPVDGFAKGRYHVDLLSREEILATVTFEVEPQ